MIVGDCRGDSKKVMIPSIENFKEVMYKDLMRNQNLVKNNRPYYWDSFSCIIGGTGSAMAKNCDAG